MRIFFLCRTGHHTSLLAAGLYLGWLKRKSEITEFMKSVRLFGDIRYSEIGTPCYVGSSNNVEVYTVGVANESTLLERAINELMYVIDVDSRDKTVINVSSAVSSWTRIGIWLMRFKLKGPADWFFRQGARIEVEKVAELLKKHGMEKKMLE